MNIITKFVLPIGLAAVTVFTGCTDPKELEAHNRTLSISLDEARAKIKKLETENRTQADYIASESSKYSKLAKDFDSERKAKEALDAKCQKLVKTLKKLDKPGAGDEKIVLISSPLPKGLNKALNKFASANPGLVSFDEKNGMVKLKSDFTFAPGSDVVNANAQDALRKLVAILKTPEAADFSVYVAGHTDDMRISRDSTRRKHPTNWHLSVHRAIGVEKTLVKDGLSPARIAVMGFGEYHPIVPNKPGRKGAAANRRVEIWIVPTGAFLTNRNAASAEEATPGL